MQRGDAGGIPDSNDVITLSTAVAMSSHEASDMTSPDYRVLCDQFRAALAGARVYALSLHDHRGEVLYLSEGVLGPDEHEIVQQAVTRFSSEEAPDSYISETGQNRTAVAFAARDSRRLFCGLVLVIIDQRGSNGDPRTLRNPLMRETLKGFARTLNPPPIIVRPDDTATVRRRRLALSVVTPLVAPEVYDLRIALRRLPLDLFVQRLIPLDSGPTTPRYEVLLRSKSAAASSEAPHSMLRAAVEHGLGSIIDRRVLLSLIGWLMNHRAAVTSSGGSFSVNLTATTLHDAQFGRFLERVLRTSALPRGHIAIELDSSLCLQYRGSANALCATLEQLGCPVVLDNFEPYDRGFDLLRLPGVQVLKLSSAITQAMRSDAVARAIVAAVVQASRVLGIHTVAKHGDLAVDAEWLRSVGIDFLQSYSATKPRFLHSLAS